MVLLRSKLAFAVIGAGMCIAAAPAQANTATASAAVGAIDVSKVAAEAQDTEDTQFRQLFARWESADKPNASSIHSAVAVPSRMPLEGARLSSDYGMRIHPVLGGRRAHKGVDLAAPIGTPIYATADGYVSKAGPFSSYGNYVALEHGAEVETRYAHMSRVAVTEGQRVKKGDIIGYVGTTGRSTGPHLHYEVRVGGESVNPVPYMVESQAQRAFALATANANGH